MENYDWEKNRAVVLRMYYSERIFLTSTMFASAFTLVNMFYMQKNYFANVCRGRILPTWKYWALLNVLTIPVLLRPLTKDEMRIQWRKRLLMGKYLFTMYHMDDPDAKPEGAE